MTNDCHLISQNRNSLRRRLSGSDIDEVRIPFRSPSYYHMKKALG